MFNPIVHAEDGGGGGEGAPPPPKYIPTPTLLDFF